jgi:hypothetical protein
MPRRFTIWLQTAFGDLSLLVLITAGCTSANYAQRGTGLGALAGAGAGAVVADATGGHAGTGALIGAGLGAVTGAAVGSEMDYQQEQYRAQIAAQMGRQVAAGAATMDGVIQMTQSGIDPVLIQNYVRSSGMTQPLSAGDVIYLHNQGVSTDVIQVMQTASVPAPVPVAVAQRPPVIVEEHYYEAPYCGPHFGYSHHWGPRPSNHTSFGFSVMR